MSAPVDYDALWEGAWKEASAAGPGFRSRYATLLRLMAEHGAAGRFLEVGAGAGGFLDAVAVRFPWLERSAHDGSARARALLAARGDLAAVYDGDLGAGLDLGRAWDVIVCSEVLEHVDDDGAALDALVRHLRPGGRLYLSVPLRDDLWTQVDDAVGHRRRYAAGALAALCRARDLTVLADRATGFPLYNAYYRRLGRRPPADTATAAARSPVARLAGRALGALFTLEARVHTPWGGRGFVVARKAPARA